MSIYEKDCKWHFAALEENAGDEGPNSAMSQTFSKFPCAALIRESIQNSLDAVVDENEYAFHLIYLSGDDWVTVNPEEIASIEIEGNKITK